jgi:hypothetical protein
MNKFIPIYPPSNSTVLLEKRERLCFSNNSECSIFTVFCRNDDNTIIIVQQDTIENFYRKSLTPIFNKAIRNLLNTRKHLALQLELECGNISEEFFLEEEDKYLLETEKIPFDELKKEIDLLFRFSDMALDAEEVSNILNCPIEDAEKAINKLYIES